MSEIIEGKPQIAPGFCFICEQSNDCRYIDTFRDFEGIVREKLDGRKYVCEPCVEEFAGKFGFITEKNAEILRAKIRQQAAALAQADEDLAAYDDLKAALEHFSKPKPAAKKPAAAKAA